MDVMIGDNNKPYDAAINKGCNAVINVNYDGYGTAITGNYNMMQLLMDILTELIVYN